MKTHKKTKKWLYKIEQKRFVQKLPLCMYRKNWTPITTDHSVWGHPKPNLLFGKSAPSRRTFLFDRKSSPSQTTSLPPLQRTSPAQKHNCLQEFKTNYNICSPKNCHVFVHINLPCFLNILICHVFEHIKLTWQVCHVFEHL